MGLVFMPLQGIAFATLPTRYRTEGASLMNLSRNIGASVGISLVTTLLARSVQISHADMAPKINPENLNMMDPGLLQILGGSGDAVLAMANAEINRQAMMIGYLNDFWAMMIVTALSVPLVLFLRKPKGPAEKPDASAMGH
jgi:DHA2 family multidrug resistance protein